jgi:uncharacterized membrane protein
MSTDNQFDDKFKSKVEKTIKEFDFKSHSKQDEDVFELKELNIVIKGLNKNSKGAEDKINNQMLQNTSQEFRKIILNLADFIDDCKRQYIVSIFI